MFLIFYSTAVCSCIKIYRASNVFHRQSLNRAILAFLGCKDASCASTCFRPCSGLSAEKTHPQNFSMKAILIPFSVYEGNKHGSIFLCIADSVPITVMPPWNSPIFYPFHTVVDFTVHRARRDHTSILSHPCLTLSVAVHSTDISYKKKDNFPRSVVS